LINITLGRSEIKSNRTGSNTNTAPFQPKCQTRFKLCNVIVKPIVMYSGIKIKSILKLNVTK